MYYVLCILWCFSLRLSTQYYVYQRRIHLMDADHKLKIVYFQKIPHKSILKVIHHLRGIQFYPCSESCTCITMHHHDQTRHNQYLEYIFIRITRIQNIYFCKWLWLFIAQHGCFGFLQNCGNCQIWDVRQEEQQEQEEQEGVV